MPIRGLPNRGASFVRRAVIASLLLVGGQAWALVDPALFQDLHWRLVGPFRGGRVLAVSGVPGEPDHFYFGSVNGGVWESLDAGRTWRPVFDDQPVGSIGAIAVAPSAPRTIYVGTGEADMRSDIAQGKGVFKSTDGGKSWQSVGLEDSQQIGRIRVDPRNADVVFVAALGHPYGPNEERGLFRSRDGGKSWQKVLGPDENTGAIDVAFAPDDPDVLYAALWQTRRTPWNIYPPSNGPGSGLFKSTDGGDHWTEIRGDGFPASPGRIGVVVAPSRPERVYAIVDAEAGGFYRSDDAGQHWTRTSDDERIWQRAWYFGGLAVEPRDADVVYVGNTNLYRSSDGGETFVPIEGDRTGDDYHEMWINPESPERRILGVDQGTVVSVDGGASWSSWHNQPTAQMYHVSTDDRFPYWVYGSQQDSGAVGLPSQTATGDGITMQHFRELTAGGESQNIAPDPLDPRIIFGGTVDRLDLRTDQTRSIDPTLAYPDHWRHTWTLPLAFSRLDPRCLYFARQKVFRTCDGGEHWAMISEDLTREDPGAPPNLDPITAGHDLGLGPRRGVVYALAPSPLAEGDLWAGTDDGLIWRTRDAGATWENITPAQLTPWSKVGIIEPSTFDVDTAYAAVDRHRLDDRRPYIYRTTDAGKTWVLIVDGIDPGHFVNAVREDPRRKGLLYAATEEGVYVSFDDGTQWQSLQLGLPVTSVRDLVVHEDDLVIATHGRGIWILDDASPLRQIDARVAESPVWLFAPAAAYRVRRPRFTGTPLPKDEPTAPNPPLGARIDYHLAARPSSPITLEIRDASGAPVRRYSSADAAPQADLSRLRMAPQWFVPPVVLVDSPGMHRFIWPLRYAAPPEISKDDAFHDGVWAPPGTYTAVLTVDGREWSQPLRVEPDPRVVLDAADYRQQFDLARAIEAASARVAAATNGARALVTALVDRRAKTEGDLGTRLDTYLEQVREVQGIRPAPNANDAWAFPPRRLDSLRWIGGALSELLEAVDGADSAPSPDAREGFEKLQPKVEATLESWRSATEELESVNRALIAAGVEPIELKE